MPEGHTLHRLAREFRRRMGGQQLTVSSPQGRFSDGASLLDRSVLTRTDAHGKQLFLGFAPDGAPGGPVRWLRVHLGLYGTWTFGALDEHGQAPTPRGAVRARLVGAEEFADLRGPAACEVVSPVDKRAVHDRLGPDPLRRDGDPGRFVARVARSSAPVGTLLMDQAVVAGVGNVYRAEVLFRAGLSPFLPGRVVPAEDVLALWDDLSVLMRDGVRRGQIVTVHRGERPRPRGPVAREDSFYVYRRTGLPCRRCGTPVATQVMATRNLYWCPSCQA